MAVRWPSHLISFLPFLPSCHPWHPWTRPASPRQPWRPSWGASEHGHLSVTNMTSFSERSMTSFTEVRVKNVISYIHRCGVDIERSVQQFRRFFFYICSITLNEMDRCTNHPLVSFPSTFFTVFLLRCLPLPFGMTANRPIWPPHDVKSLKTE